MPLPPPPPDSPIANGAPGTARLQFVDSARAAAIVQMIAYHFCYDLNYFGWIHVALTREPVWIAWRTAIVAQFLFVAGVALSLRAGAAHAVVPPATRRWWQIAACAALVSAASAALFGPRWIWFGVLHFIAVAQVLVWPLRGRTPAMLLLLGAALLLLGLGLQLDGFAPNGLSWIGFSPVKPNTEDFVPLLPWLGVLLLGMAGGLWLQRSDHAAAQSLRRFDAARGAPLALIGRWPLTIYMLHQPLLMGTLWLLRAMAPPSP